jgi:hypothetical protein
VERSSKTELPERLKDGVKHYIDKFGLSDVYRGNGEIMWKFLHWLWKHYRKELKEYFRLTENWNFHKYYKKATGKDHLCKTGITLEYINWIYQNKNVDLGILMRQINPIIQRT